jgi:hypothetical protein
MTVIMNWKAWGRKRYWPNLRHYPGFYMGGLKKIMTNLRQDRRCWDSNRTLSEYKSETLSLEQTCSEFDQTDQISISLHSSDTWNNVGVHQLFLSREPMTHSGEEFCYNIIIEFGIPIKLVRLIKLYFNETFVNVSMLFLFGTVWKKVMINRHTFWTLLYKILGRSEKTVKNWNRMGHISFWSMLIHVC